MNRSSGKFRPETSWHFCWLDGWYGRATRQFCSKICSKKLVNFWKLLHCISFLWQMSTTDPTGVPEYVTLASPLAFPYKLTLPYKKGSWIFSAWLLRKDFSTCFEIKIPAQKFILQALAFHYLDCRQSENAAVAKGQLISKCHFSVFNSPKNRTKTIRLEVP